MPTEFKKRRKRNYFWVCDERIISSVPGKGYFFWTEFILKSFGCAYMNAIEMLPFYMYHLYFQNFHRIYKKPIQKSLFWTWTESAKTFICPKYCKYGKKTVQKMPRWHYLKAIWFDIIFLSTWSGSITIIQSYGLFISFASFMADYYDDWPLKLLRKLDGGSKSSYISFTFYNIYCKLYPHIGWNLMCRFIALRTILSWKNLSKMFQKNKLLDKAMFLRVAIANYRSIRRFFVNKIEKYSSIQIFHDTRA